MRPGDPQLLIADVVDAADVVDGKIVAVPRGKYQKKVGEVAPWDRD